ncbi:hypothetical protein TNCV_1425141 [Trichonephila clavipes]|nr:hypothetical protein TNCV_1425141 [Trichonephila clavipes]
MAEWCDVHSPDENGHGPELVVDVASVESGSGTTKDPSCGCGSPVVKGTNSRPVCHEFEPQMPPKTSRIKETDTR